jgi:alkylation response protein AidB-like acyl-CoA dehydrogenase
VNFDLDDDLLALQSAIRDVCRRSFPTSRVRAGVDHEGWSILRDAGVFSLRAPEDHGGAGLGMTAAAIVFEELGRALVPGPLVGTHVAATNGIDGIVTMTERDVDLVDHLAFSAHACVLGRDDAVLVDAAGIAADPIEPPLDPLTPVSRVRSVPEGERVALDVSRVRAVASVLTAAFLVGIASAETDLAVAYARQRRQFGRTIGSFQAVKHLCADMLVRAEVARAAVHAAAVGLDGNGDGDTGRAVASGALLAGEAALKNGKACVQVHGGMGFTWEVDVHLYLKRAVALTSLHRAADALASDRAASL